MMKVVMGVRGGGGGFGGLLGVFFFGQKIFFLLFHADSNHSVKYHKNLFLKGEVTIVPP